MTALKDAALPLAAPLPAAKPTVALPHAIKEEGGGRREEAREEEKEEPEEEQEEEGGGRKEEEEEEEEEEEGQEDMRILLRPGCPPRSLTCLTCMDVPSSGS